MSIAIKDIAERANVSVSTVSYVLNEGPRRIVGETRKRVLRVMKELNYSPSPTARSLVLKKTHTICLAISHRTKRVISDPYFLEILAGICDVTEKLHYSLVFPIVNSDTVTNVGYFDSLDKKLVDGVILLAPSVNDPIIKKIIKKEVPLVLVGHHPDLKKGAWVGTNGEEITCRAIEHLIKLGHKQIGFMGSHFNYTFAQDRIEGYKSALRRYNLEVKEDYILEGENTFEGGYRIAKKLLKRKDRPTAIFVMGGIMMAGVLKAGKEMGIQIPGGLALICFDDFPFAEYSQPTITTIRQPVREIGETAVKLLLEIMGRGTDINSKTERGIILDSKLICRESCGCGFFQGKSYPSGRR